MTLSKHGIKRRIAALLAALLIFGTSVIQYPARAAAALPVIGAAVTVSAFLMACGVYPYMAGTDGETFESWTDDSLSNLWGQYVADSSDNVPDFHALGGLLSGATLLIGSAIWGQLSKFVQWFKAKFSVSDNQEGVQIGVTSSLFFPVLGGDSVTSQDVLDAGFLGGTGMSDGAKSYFASANPYHMLVGLKDGSSARVIVEAGRANNPNWYYVRVLDGTLGSLTKVEGFSLDYFRDEQNVRHTFYVNYLNNFAPSSFVPTFDSWGDAYRYYLSYLGESTFSGITADTTTVAVPAALPEGRQFGGLSIPAAGTIPTVGTLAGVIEQGVIERQQPQVVPVEVTVTGVDVDTETGTIIENPVAVTPEAVPQIAADYAIPGLHTVFPFSIPWDIYNIFAALNAPPQRPYWDVSLTIPALFTGGESVQVPFTIGVKDGDPLAITIDATAAKIRAFLLVLMCVATLVLFFRR